MEKNLSDLSFDDVLVRHCSGDGDATKELMSRKYAWLVDLVRRRCSSMQRADQDAMATELVLKLFSASNRVSCEQAFERLAEKYLKRYLVPDDGRRQRREREKLAKAVEKAKPWTFCLSGSNALPFSPSAPLRGKELIEKVRQIVKVDLTEDERLLVRARFLGQTKKIANDFGCSTDTVLRKTQLAVDKIVHSLNGAQITDVGPELAHRLLEEFGVTSKEDALLLNVGRILGSEAAPIDERGIEWM